MGNDIYPSSTYTTGVASLSLSRRSKTQPT